LFDFFLLSLVTFISFSWNKNESRDFYDAIRYSTFNTRLKADGKTVLTNARNLCRKIRKKFEKKFLEEKEKG